MSDTEQMIAWLQSRGCYPSDQHEDCPPGIPDSVWDVLERIRKRLASDSDFRAKWVRKRYQEERLAEVFGLALAAGPNPGAALELRLKRN